MSGRLLAVIPCVVQFYYHNLCGEDDAWKLRTIPAANPFSNVHVEYTDCGAPSCNLEDARSHHCKDAVLAFDDVYGVAHRIKIVDNSGSAILIENMTLGSTCTAPDTAHS